MRAMQLGHYGGPEALKLVDLQRPVPGKDQILIRVRATSVNPVDWKKASGKYRLVMPLGFPCIPGFDVSGEVAQAGPGADSFAKGTRVHARMRDSGACAEFAVCGVDVTARMPSAMAFDVAAGLPLAGLTALQSLRDYAGLSLEGNRPQGARPRVLVVGASGGVGHLAVQIAKAADAFVVGVCSARNVTMVRGLGADEVLDYQGPNPYSGQELFEVVLDCVAGNPGPCLPLLTAHGCYVSTLPSPATVLRGALNMLGGRQVKAMMLKPNAADLDILDRLFEAGRLKVVVASRHPLQALGAAWERSMSGHVAGKVIVEIDADGRR